MTKYVPNIFYAIKHEFTVDLHAWIDTDLRYPICLLPVRSRISCNTSQTTICFESQRFMRLLSGGLADFIGYSAFSTQHQEPNFGERMYFAEVTLNAGGGYDSSTSIFTCPTSGFYYFYISILMNIHYTRGSPNSVERCYMDIVLEGATKASVRIRMTSYLG